MTQYKLIKEWLITPNEQPFKIINVDINNVLEYQSNIDWIIESFNNRYEWGGFPKWEDVINRLETGKNFFFLCEYNDKIIGWVWFRKGEVDINKDHIKFYSKTNDTTVWGFNNFLVSNKIIQKPNNAGGLWCSLMFEKLFELGMTDILVDVESWQDISLKMCEESGMKKVDWINELVKQS
jgi:hypothetical protein